jgi:hypothetical protein
VKDQRLNTDHERSRSDDNGPTTAEIQHWGELDAAAANKGLREVEETIAEVRRDMAANGVSGPHLISVDELRAAGALDVPAAWRKSLGVERDLFSGLFDEDDSLAADGQPAVSDPERDGRARELS